MSRGTKNYFRHAIGAHVDPKIQKAIDLIGLEAYACYFIILEIVAEQCENQFKESVLIHKRVIANALRKRSDSVHLVVTKLVLSGLLSADYDGTNFQLSIPNLAKYMGKYESKNDLNIPNKKKEKERKEKESKRKENNEEIDARDPDKITPTNIITLWDENIAGVGVVKKFYGHMLPQKALDNFLITSGFQEFSLCEQWKCLFKRLSACESIISGDWSVDLTWAVIHDNAVKVMSGKYDKSFKKNNAQHKIDPVAHCAKIIAEAEAEMVDE